MLSPPAVRRRLRQGVHHIEIERLARRARLLGLLQHGDGTNAARQGCQECVRGERAVQADLQHADPLAQFVQRGRGGAAPFRRRSPS